MTRIFLILKAMDGDGILEHARNFGHKFLIVAFPN